MKYLLNLGFVVVALALLIFFNTLRTNSSSAERSTGSASGKKPQTFVGLNNLPNDDYEDMSFVFSTSRKH